MPTRCSVCNKFTSPLEKHSCSGKPAGKPKPSVECGKCGLFTTAGSSHQCKSDPPPVVVEASSPLTALYRKGHGAIYPMNRWEPNGKALVDRLNGTHVKGRRLSCSDDMLKRLVTVLAFIEKESLLNTCSATTWKIGAFMELDPGFQIQIIDNLWNECTMQKSHEKLPHEMVETTDEVRTKVAQLPSSVRPAAGPGGGYVKGPVDRPFQTMGLGFRVDGALGSKQSITSIDRVTKEGMKAQALNAAFMLKVRKMLVTETTVARDTAMARVYVRAQDLFNETAVCVSRSFFGATAFPERTTNDEVALWAVDCSGLRGFDTEAHQIRENAKPWRPGEKCFPQIPAANVVGYVKIRRAPAGNNGANGGWRFTIPMGATWTYVHEPIAAKKQYLEEELAAWATGTEHSVSGDYDFVS